MSTTFTQLVDYKRTGGVISGIADKAAQAIGLDQFPFSLNDTNKNVEVQPLGSGIIDIVNDFDWIVNKTGYNYNKIPKIFVTERAQQESTLVSAYYYYITNILSTVNTRSSVSVQTAIDKFTSKFALDPNGTTAGAINSVTDSSTVQGVLKFVKSVANDFASLTINDSQILGEYLKSYIGIYITKPTGFRYIFPHLEDNKFTNINNTWTSYDNNPLLKGVENIADNVIPLVRPGVFVENPQYFNFGDAGAYDTVEVRFPLLNTLTNTYKKNYELLWLLAFQNKYYRESFAAVRPPKIYTVQIPGQKYMPYAYISKLEVDYVGTRRILTVDTPVGAVDTPVPDAYEVKITFKSLLSDSANTMVSEGFNKQIVATQTNSR